MSAIILLSALADAERVVPIIDAMVEERLDARWIPIGGAHDVEAEAAIAAARCVLLVWSTTTAAVDALVFQALAAQTVAQGKAIGVMLDQVDPPAPLAATTRYDLSGWRGRPSRWRALLGGGLYMRDVVTAAKYKLAGRDPAPPSAPRKMLVRQLLATIPAVFAVIALVPTLYGFWRDLDMASPAERRAWAATDPTDCASLRVFLSRFPGGSQAGEAQARLAGRTMTSETRWVRAERQLPLFVGGAMATPAATGGQARVMLDGRLAEEAGRVCRGLAQAGGARFSTYRLGDEARTCTAGADGFRCGFDGTVSCVQREPRAVEVERCTTAVL